MSDTHPIEAEARRLAGGTHARGAIPARFWRTAIDAVAHDHDPASCGECREDFALRFGAAPPSEDAAPLRAAAQEVAAWADDTIENEGLRRDVQALRAALEPR